MAKNQGEKNGINKTEKAFGQKKRARTTGLFFRAFINTSKDVTCSYADCV